jgi:pilus assembly protein CpaF
MTNNRYKGDSSSPGKREGLSDSPEIQAMLASKQSSEVNEEVANQELVVQPEALTQDTASVTPVFGGVPGAPSLGGNEAGVPLPSNAPDATSTFVPSLKPIYATNLEVPQADAIPVSNPLENDFVPSVAALSQPNAPKPVAFAAASAPQATSGVPTRSGASYFTTGVVSAEQVINGDPEEFAELDQYITEVMAKVQQELVAKGETERIVEARRDAAVREQLANEIDRVALKFLLTGRSLGGVKNKIIVNAVVSEILGLGPLEPLWTDPSITEVIVNGPKEVYVERAGKLLRARGVRFRSQEHLTEVCQRILSPLNRKLDVKDPLADGRLPDGSRVNAVHYAIAPGGPLLTIRRFPQVNRSLVNLVDLGAMSEEMACNLGWLIANKATTLVCGGTGTGKTTMLNALSAAIPRYERVVTIEDSLELRLHPESHVAAMEARPSDASGQNAVPIRSLVKNALRMRPDRIIVGEIRDQAALDMLQACNTGHEGSMSTVHANGPSEAVARLAVMVAQGGEIPADKVDWLVGSALDLIVMIRRYKDGSRRVSGVYEVPEADSIGGGPLTTIPLWEWKRLGEDENGRITGEYQKVNDLSQKLRDKLGLDFEPMLSYDDLKALIGAKG